MKTRNSVTEFGKFFMTMLSNNLPKFTKWNLEDLRQAYPFHHLLLL